MNGESPPFANSVGLSSNASEVPRAEIMRDGAA